MAGFARVPSGGARYLLDLNTGARLPGWAACDTAGAPPFWYVIGRSVAHQDGIALYGPPASEVIAAPRPTDLYTAIRTLMREHCDGAWRLADNRVLNGCRSVVYCRTGCWFAKRDAAGLGRRRGGRSPSTDRGRGPQVRAFLAWGRARFDGNAATVGA